MPEWPDITAEGEPLRDEVLGRVLQRVKVNSPFLLRTALPQLAEAEGRRTVSVERRGKRVVLALEGGHASSST